MPNAPHPSLAYHAGDFALAHADAIRLKPRQDVSCRGLVDPLASERREPLEEASPGDELDFVNPRLVGDRRGILAMAEASETLGTYADGRTYPLPQTWNRWLRQSWRPRWVGP